MATLATTPIASSVQNAQRHTTLSSQRATRARIRQNKNDTVYERTTTRAMNVRQAVYEADITKQDVRTKISTVTSKVQVIAASEPIAVFVLPFYLTVQLPFALISLVGLGSETIVTYFSWGVLSSIAPIGLTLFFCGYTIAVIVGMLSMIVAASVYTLRSISLFKGTVLITWIFCLTAYFVPFFNLFPWVAAFIAIVVWSRK